MKFYIESKAHNYVAYKNLWNKIPQAGYSTSFVSLCIAAVSIVHGLLMQEYDLGFKLEAKDYS